MLDMSSSARRCRRAMHAHSSAWSATLLCTMEQQTWLSAGRQIMAWQLEGFWRRRRRRCARRASASCCRSCHQSTTLTLLRPRASWARCRPQGGPWTLMNRDGGPLRGTSTQGQWRCTMKQMTLKAQVLHSQDLYICKIVTKHDVIVNKRQ